VTAQITLSDQRQLAVKVAASGAGDFAWPALPQTRAGSVPGDSILVEPCAKNTSENFTLSRDRLAQQGIHADSIIVGCRPYQQRRAYGIARKIWPELEAMCTREPTSLDECIVQIGDTDRPDRRRMEEP